MPAPGHNAPSQCDFLLVTLTPDSVLLLLKMKIPRHLLSQCCHMGHMWEDITW